jgi:Holliday junction resolvase RusA-like endonuclease
VIYDIDPVGKPRMTRRDKWAQRPAVMRYRTFCDAIRAAGVTLPESPHVTFTLPMPASWSRYKRSQHEGQPHRQRPDADNLLKALLDALYDEDAHVWDVRVSKRWGRTGQIIIQEAS